jgi:hypothetical protein
VKRRDLAKYAKNMEGGEGSGSGERAKRGGFARSLPPQPK